MTTTVYIKFGGWIIWVWDNHHLYVNKFTWPLMSSSNTRLSQSPWKSVDGRIQWWAAARSSSSSSVPGPSSWSWKIWIFTWEPHRLITWKTEKHLNMGTEQVHRLGIYKHFLVGSKQVHHLRNRKASSQLASIRERDVKEWFSADAVNSSETDCQ